jgi:hypothetical protein
MTKYKSITKVAATLILCSVAGMASAGGGRGGWHGGGGGWPGGGYNPPKPPYAAPEIDPASAGSALTLLLGGLAVLRSRRNARGK